MFSFFREVRSTRDVTPASGAEHSDPASLYGVTRAASSHVPSRALVGVTASPCCGFHARDPLVSGGLCCFAPRPPPPRWQPPVLCSWADSSLSSGLFPDPACRRADCVVPPCLTPRLSGTRWRSGHTVAGGGVHSSSTAKIYPAVYRLFLRRLSRNPGPPPCLGCRRPGHGEHRECVNSLLLSHREAQRRKTHPPGSLGCTGSPHRVMNARAALPSPPPRG